MSESVAPQMTSVIGYFNPNPHHVYVEVSELNLKCELKPGQYIRDRAGHYINDPILDRFVKPKGLSKATSPQPVEINFVPRLVRAERPVHSVTQATGFVRQADGTTIPSYAQAPATHQAESAINKIPIMGMSVAKARELGLIGKPRLISEDYGTPDSQGAPAPTTDLPSMKYSIESPPRIRTAAPMTPELMEADPRLAPDEVARRAQLQRQMNQASQSQQPESFDPASVTVAGSPAPVRLRAPAQPAHIVAASTAVPVRPVPAVNPAQIPPRVAPRRIASVVVEPPVAVEPANEESVNEGAAPEVPEDTSGLLQPMQEGETMPEPTLDTPQVPQGPSGEETDKRFVCGADGKCFKYRSELERYVNRKYPQMAVDLMKPYPPEG